jgi:polysaccharide biosynthesis transport protein
MTNESSSGAGLRPRHSAPPAGLPLEHFVRLIYHRKWLVLSVFGLIAGGTAFYAESLPNIYQSETVILVDPQKVPESYVKSTVTGDIHNRLGTLSQQILSATRLQKIIDTLNLYPEERKKNIPREDIITKMRSEITPGIVGDWGGSQDLQAFKISYRGKDPRLVAQVTNELASLFIDENIKVREAQATGTTEFLENQLQDTRKVLEDQETKLRDFRLKHVGEMPEQQSADLQLVGQLQAQLQLEGEALSRAELQKNMYESMMTQTAPVVDTDSPEELPVKPEAAGQAATVPPLVNIVSADKARLAVLLKQYTPAHPDVRRLTKKIEDEEAQLAADDAAQAAAAVPVPPPTEATANPAQVNRTVSKRRPPPVSTHFNPILQSQLKAIDAEIEKHKAEQDRLSKSFASYRQKLDQIPVREQEIAGLTRDYEMSKAHYAGLLDRELSAQTATQLEIRQKGEKFEVLDPAQPSERPISPRRMFYDAAGAIFGLGLGLVMALATELLGMSITGAQDISDASSLKVLGIIPVIETQRDRRTRHRRLVLAGASATFATLVLGAVLFLKFHSRI